jgi:hypothetical protein
VLASVVPGLREIRAPLAAGYLWLIAAWLLVADHVPHEDKATGLLARAYDLEHAVSTFGLGVAVSFVAYLVGSVTEAWAKRVYDGAAGYVRRTKNPSTQTSVSLPVLDLAIERVMTPVFAMLQEGDDPRRVDQTEVRRAKTQVELVRDEHGEQLSDQDQLDAFVQALVDVAAERASDEMDLAMTRMIGAEPELYSEVDRLRAESDLRFAILPPLLLVTSILTFEGSLYWLFTLPFAAVLLWQAVETRDRAERRLVDAIRLRRTSTPGLEEFESMMQKAAERSALEREAPVSTRLPTSPE